MQPPRKPPRQPRLVAHHCDTWCTCPQGHGPLLYTPAADQHACPEPTCTYAHGLPASKVYGSTDWVLARGLRPRKKPFDW